MSDHPLVSLSEPTPLNQNVVRSTVDDFLAALSEGTSDTYRRSLAAFATYAGCDGIVPAMGTLLHGNAGTAFSTINRWKTAMIAEGLSPATINLRLTAMRSVLTFANDCGLIPWKTKVRALKHEQKDMRGPTREGMLKMFAACGGDEPMMVRDRALLRLLYNAALRRAEACSLDLEHIDLDAATASVLRKGRKVRVTVPLSSSLIAALRAWIAVRDPTSKALLQNFDPTGKGGLRLTGRGVAGIVGRIAARAGLDPKVTRAHGVRHSALTSSLDESGGDLRKVMEFAGHAGPSMLMRYDDARKNHARDIANLLDAAD